MQSPALGSIPWEGAELDPAASGTSGFDFGKVKPNSSPNLTPVMGKGDAGNVVPCHRSGAQPETSSQGFSGTLALPPLTGWIPGRFPSPLPLRSTLRASPVPKKHKKPELQSSSPILPLHLHGGTRALLPNPDPSASSTLQTPRALGSEGQERVLLEGQN